MQIESLNAATAATSLFICKYITMKEKIVSMPPLQLQVFSYNFFDYD